MKPKNVMLLGFVNKAVEYLDKHLDDDTPDSRLSELKNIDLQALKKELSENLDSSLGTMQSTMTTLLRAGNEAFGAFIGKATDKDDVIEQLDRIFDVDFDTKESKEKDELSRLLSFYNLEDQFEIDEEYPELLNPSDEKEEVYEDDDEFMKQIRENANKAKGNNEENHSEIYNEGVHELDSIFSEIVTAEDDKPIDEEFKTNTFNTAVRPIIVEEIPSESEEVALVEAMQEQKLAEPEIIEKIEEEVVQTVQQEEVVEPEEELSIEQQYIVNPLVDVNIPVTSVETNEVENNNEDAQEYASSLIEDLRKQMIEEDEKKRVLDAKKAEVYVKIHELYPYLSQAFVGSVYDLKEDINNEFPLNIDIILLHRLVFDDLDKLRQFVEVVLRHEYAINADENKMIVDVFKEFENSDGRILSNIFEIANQANLLGGYYDGYRVMVK